MPTRTIRNGRPARSRSRNRAASRSRFLPRCSVTMPAACHTAGMSFGVQASEGSANVRRVSCQNATREGGMLGEKDAIATIAVKKLDAASKFYEGRLGLQQVSRIPGAITYRSGSSTVLVYESQFAGTNK